jgi:hypothetical protein
VEERVKEQSHISLPKSSVSSYQQDQEEMIPQKLLIDRSLRLEPAIGFEPMTC